MYLDELNRTILDFIAGYNAANEWVKITDNLPERKHDTDYSQVPCLCVYWGEVCILVFNHEHECWDQEDGDDYCCDIGEVKLWRYLPEPPTT